MKHNLDVNVDDILIVVLFKSVIYMESIRLHAKVNSELWILMKHQ